MARNRGKEANRVYACQIGSEIAAPRYESPSQNPHLYPKSCRANQSARASLAGHEPARSRRAPPRLMFGGAEKRTRGKRRRRKKQRLRLEASVFPPPWCAAPRRRRAHPHLPQASRDGRRGDLAVAWGERTRLAAAPLRGGDVTAAEDAVVRCGVKQSFEADRGGGEVSCGGAASWWY
jgi:hypothetical protein